MDKPITMRIEELEEEIVTAVNKSQLPAFVVERTLRDLHQQSLEQAKMIAMKEKEEYKKAVSKDGN